VDADEDADALDDALVLPEDLAEPDELPEELLELVLRQLSLPPGPTTRGAEFSCKPVLSTMVKRRLVPAAGVSVQVMELFVKPVHCMIGGVGFAESTTPTM